MTASGGGDPRVLAAAARISDAHTSLDAVGRRVAAEQLSDYPALATDPRLPGPVLVDPGLVHRRTAEVLTTAGGADFHHAAERLAGWAEPVVALPALQQQLDVWLPASAVVAGPAALTRRLLCDAAGLARTPWSTHAVSVAALDLFARTAMDHTDDAELIDEDSLRRVAAAQSWGGGVVEALAEVCGFAHLFGSLAVRKNRFSLSKAALLHLQRSVSRHEVAKLTGLTPEAVGMAFSTCASIIRTGYRRWAAHNDPQFARFAEAVAETADDVGLIDEPRLKNLASKCGWVDSLEEFVAYAGYVRLNEQLAMSDTHRAKVKAAVKHHGDGAPIARIAETAGLSPKAAESAARNVGSVRLAKGTCRIVTPPRPPLAELAQANADDVGVVNVDRFVADAEMYGYNRSGDKLVAQCGLVELFGSFALKKTTAAAVKAALLDLRRPAALAELANLTTRSPKTVSHALTETASIVRVGRRWAIDTDDGALAEFAAAAADAADDVGLVNEHALQEFADKRGWSDRFDELVKGCGLEQVEGCLALDKTRRAATKAVLCNVGRPATTREIAATTGIAAGDVANVLTGIASVTRIRPSLWVTTDLAGGAFARFGAALGLCSDDVGLIDETRLTAIAQQQTWGMSVGELVEVCELPRLHGTLAMVDTAAAAAKAALLELGRPATLYELEDITGCTYGAIRNALARVSSVQRTSRGVRGERGLLTVCDPQNPPQPAPNPDTSR